MKKQTSPLRRYLYLSLCVILIGTAELWLLREKASLFLFTEWNALGKPPSEAEYVVEYGYVKSKDGNIHKHYAVVDPQEGWKSVWLETDKIDDYYAYDSDISTCHIPDIINVKSMVIRCRKLENYSKTYAMAIGNDGRVYDYIGPSPYDIVSRIYEVALVLLVNLNFGFLIILIGSVLERIGERNRRKANGLSSDTSRPAGDARLVKRMHLLEKTVRNIGAPVQRGTVRCGNITTSYLRAGSGKPLLLVHGGDAGAGGIRWFPVIGPLAKTRHVVVPDVVGYGESDKPYAVYDRRYFSEWLCGIIRNLGLRDVSVAGHSVGGAIAAQLAIDHPEAVGRLILVNSAGLGAGRREFPVPLKLQMIWQNLFPSCARSRRLLEQYGLFDPRALTEAMLAVEEYGNEVIRSPGGRNVFWLGRGKVIRPFAAEEISRIRCPTLILWGAEDGNFPPAIAERASRSIGNAELILIPDAGHNVIYDQPEKVIQSINAFLKKEE